MTLRFLAPQSRAVLTAFTAFLALTLFFNGQAFAHNVDTSDAAFLQAQSGVVFWPYFYLGAKHMVTGLDHLLFLAGVVFFLRSFRDVAVYVSLFALGHSLTLIVGVMLQTNANPYLVDAIIGFSVVYKALENLAQQRRRRCLKRKRHQHASGVVLVGSVESWRGVVS